MQKLVFSRYSGKLGTATRHQGPKTGTVWSVRENPSKSPKRPALPGAVNREGAVSRHRPFVLLVFHTLSAALIRAFFRKRETRGFLRERSVGSVPHTGAHTGLFGVGPGAFPALGRNSAHRATRGATGGTGFLSGGEHIRTGLFRLFLGGISVIQELPDGGRHVTLVKTA